MGKKLFNSWARFERRLTKIELMVIISVHRKNWVHHWDLVFQRHCGLKSVTSRMPNFFGIFLRHLSSQNVQTYSKALNGDPILYITGCLLLKIKLDTQNSSHIWKASFLVLIYVKKTSSVCPTTTSYLPIRTWSRKNHGTAVRSKEVGDPGADITYGRWGF